MKNYAVVLAAGKGTRMKSAREDVSKVAFPILGRPMLQWVLESLKAVKFDRIVTVVGFGGKRSEEIAAPYGDVVWQKEQKGTGHAVMMAAPILAEEEGVTLVCRGDMPLLTDKTLSALLSAHGTRHDDLTVLTSFVDDPRGYGRIIKKNGSVERIVEPKDTTPDIEAIHEINAGVYVFNNRELFKFLKKNASSSSREDYLGDVVSAFVAEGKKVSAFCINDVEQIGSVNDRYQLALATKALRNRINRRWMSFGVTLEDPDTTYIGPDATLSRDVTIRSNTHVLGNSSIGEGSIIGPDSYIENTLIGENNVIEYSHIVDCFVDNETTIGPFARLRKGTHVRDHAHIGNFTEMKNASFGVGSRAGHLSYIGDTEVGDDVNIGCGTAVANWDGVGYASSIIDDHAFIGSGSTLISPVHIGESALIAAGSTITEDVMPHDMAIARNRQENKEGYADTFKEKAEKKHR